MRERKRERLKRQSGGENIEREHGRLRVLGRAAVQGVTVGIHYLTVYCHSCGLRFCSGQEYRGITTRAICTYMCVAKCDILSSKTRLLKSRGFQLAAFPFTHITTRRDDAHCFPCLYIYSNDIHRIRIFFCYQ